MWLGFQALQTKKFILSLPEQSKSITKCSYFKRQQNSPGPAIPDVTDFKSPIFKK